MVPQDRCQVSILRYRFGCKGKSTALGLYQGKAQGGYSAFKGDTGCSAARWQCSQIDPLTKWLDKLNDEKCGVDEDPAWYVHKSDVLDLHLYEKSIEECFGEMLMNEIHKRANGHFKDNVRVLQIPLNGGRKGKGSD